MKKTKEELLELIKTPGLVEYMTEHRYQCHLVSVQAKLERIESLVEQLPPEESQTKEAFKFLQQADTLLARVVRSAWNEKEEL